MPGLPIFIMLAGVTGVIFIDWVFVEKAMACVLADGADKGDKGWICIDVAPDDGRCAGGGIGGSSMGDGVSLGMSDGFGPPPGVSRRDMAVNSGVELAERVPRVDVFFCPVGVRMAGDGRLRDGFGMLVDSSPLEEEAIRRLLPAAEVEGPLRALGPGTG